MSGSILLGFGIWMLLTADFTWTNACIGLLGALIVSLLLKHLFSALQLIDLVLSALIRLPQALWETFLIVIIPHRYTRITYQTVDHPDNPWRVFCQIFLITFTPRSLVMSDEKKGQVRLHSLERRHSE